jgi:hypothetical protein
MPHDIPMARCPHCGKVANPLRFLLYTERKPYRCASCMKESRFDRADLVYPLIVAVIGTFFAKSIFHPQGFWGPVMYLGAGIVVIAGSMWLFLRLHSLQEK